MFGLQLVNIFLRLDLCVVFEDHTSQVKISSYMVSSRLFILSRVIPFLYSLLFHYMPLFYVQIYSRRKIVNKNLFYRTSGFYIQVSWKVRESEFHSEVEEFEGRITFANGVQQQDLVIRLKNDVVST